MKHMERRGVRDLKINASAVLALVKRGETVEITERGTPVALLVPLPEKTEFQRWIDAGLITQPVGDIAAAAPLDGPVSTSLSEALHGLRDDDQR